jgi:hypothetical protein
MEAGLSNLYYPPQERGLRKTAENWGAQLESTALNNIIKETSAVNFYDGNKTHGFPVLPIRARGADSPAPRGPGEGLQTFDFQLIGKKIVDGRLAYVLQAIRPHRGRQTLQWVGCRLMLSQML